MDPGHQTETTPRSGYAAYTNTKAPDWHWLVVWDLLLNNLATGLFLVAAMADLFRPSLFQNAAATAYPVALILLLVDLLCLVLDLGDPLRFHHMLRVFKPSSPMSLGTWSLTAFSLPLTSLVALDLLSWIGFLPAWASTSRSIHNLIVAAAILPAFLSAAYKGVLFSTNAQPGWRDARFLGAYLINSAVMLGAAELLAIAMIFRIDPGTALLHHALTILVTLNIIPSILLMLELSPTLVTAYKPTHVSRGFNTLMATAFVAPTVLLLLRQPMATVVALILLLATSLATRAVIVFLPHHTTHT